ncbi:TPA: hypothetical protein ACTXXA_003006 [Legionella anisa]
MFTKENVKAAIEKLFSFDKKKKFKGDIDKYAIFDGFFDEVKNQPLESQLKLIEESWSKKIPDKISRFLLLMAVIANARGNDLPENHPEKEPINALLTHLSDGFVNGVTRFKIPRVELLNNIQKSFEDWLEVYNIHDNPEMSQDALLAFYCTACFLHTKLSKYDQTEAMKLVDEMKKNIAHKFTQLVQAHGTSLKSSESSHSSALQKLAPEKQARKQFIDNLASIKKHEAKIERLIQWKDILEKNKNPMDVFWEHHSSPELFEQFMNDLGIESTQRKQWQSFYDAKHGTNFTKFVEFVSGTSAKSFTPTMLIEKIGQTLEKLNVNLEEYEQHHIAPTKLIKEIEDEFIKLNEVEKIDIQTLKAHQSQIKSSKGITESTLSNVLFQDIRKFQGHLSMQKEYVRHLEQIHIKILASQKLGIETDGLHEPLEIMLDHAVKTVAPGDKKIASLQSVEEKIGALLQRIENTEKETLTIGQNIVDDVKKINELIDNDANNPTILNSTKSFIHKYENNFFHKVLCFFSKTYKEMFESLKDAAEKDDTTQIASILVGKAEEYAKASPVKTFLFDEAQELQTLKASPAKS